MNPKNDPTLVYAADGTLLAKLGTSPSGWVVVRTFGRARGKSFGSRRNPDELVEAIRKAASR